ncbi:aminotransferase class IV [Demequina sp. NBRC 110056]|uniref:aminotransferase class IV n=1 Tax=Demequina sp. NBRC 110056 TaxID=1570345 RepID=UPI000A01AA12|nr:aminotransferase class IV [Demequina sp. NBRC 110056]
MNPIVWAGGTLREPGEPVVAATDHGFTVGDGVFETIAVRDGTPFALSRHLARLAYSADRIGLAAPDGAAVRDGVAAVLEAGGGAVTRVRVTLTSGDGPMGSARGEGPRTLVVTGVDAPKPRGCRAVRAPWKRNERSALAGVKSTSYAENAVMVEFARSKGADEAILANTYGNLCEGTATNVFVERGGEVLTPPLASGCLAGITRGLALEWGVRAAIPMRVAAPGELPMSVLDEIIAGEAHLAVSSSTRGVQHVSNLDGHDLAAGQLLRKVSAAYELAAERNPDPAVPSRR